VVRTKGDPAELMPAVVKAIAAYDPNLAVNRIRTMSTVLDEFLAAARVGETAMLVLAAIAIVIATMGLYAIMSFTVASRTREFGVRLAIGANPRSLVAVVLGQGLKLAAAGIALGVALALVVTRLMEARLFQVAPNDPLTFGAVVAGMMVVAVLAGLAPAYRVVSVDPVSSLRAE
jgi:putative ABC transport system permease protein